MSVWEEVDEPQRSGGTKRQLGHERVANEEHAGAEPAWKMDLQDHIISVTLTEKDSWLPSRSNKRHCNVFSGRRIRSLKSTGMSGFSSSLVLLLSAISPSAGWGEFL